MLSGNGYLALTGINEGFSLYDEQTGGQQQVDLDTSTCPDASPAAFGGPWLAIECFLPDGSRQVDLDNLTTGTMTQVALAPSSCGANGSPCFVDGVGTTWISFFVIEPGCDEHCSSQGFLQNITTGAVEADPADRAGVSDDLNSASGAAATPPCPRLIYPAYSQTYGPFQGPFAGEQPYRQQIGRFTLVTGVDAYLQTPDHLYKCGSSLNLKLPLNTYASPAAVVSQAREGPPIPALHGLSLPALHPFIIPKPKGSLAALSGRTLYTLDRTTLWAGASSLR